MNKTIIMGRVGTDPEVKHLTPESSVANFTVAVNEKWKDKLGEVHESVEWFAVVAWNGMARMVEKNLTKGQKVLIEGKMKTRSWEKDGQKHYKQEVNIENMQILTWPEK